MELSPTSMEVTQLPRKLLPTSTELNLLPWKLSPNSVEVKLLPFTSMEVAMEVASFSGVICLHESFHLLPWRLASMEAAPA